MLSFKLDRTFFGATLVKVKDDGKKRQKEILGDWKGGGGGGGGLLHRVLR